MKYHYHVLSGIHCCSPDHNSVYESMNEAQDGLSWIVMELRNTELKFSGNKRSKYYECLNANYYAEISEKCFELECMEFDK